MFTILDYSSALEYSIIRRYTNIVYYYYYIISHLDYNIMERLNRRLVKFIYNLLHTNNPLFSQ